MAVKRTRAPKHSIADDVVSMDYLGVGKSISSEEMDEIRRTIEDLETDCRVWMRDETHWERMTPETRNMDTTGGKEEEL